MVNSDIIKNNIALALFVGMEFTPTKSILLDKTVTPKRAYKPEDLDYHKNWKSLMMVQKKISEIYSEDAQRLHFEKADLFDDMQIFLFNAQIEKLYKSIIEFDKWYINYKNK